MRRLRVPASIAAAAPAAVIALVSAAAVCVFVLFAWAASGAGHARSASPAAEQDPAAQVARLAALADGAIAPQGRLWVVMARTPDGLLRWSGDDPEEAARWAGEQAGVLPPGKTLWFVQVRGEAVRDDPDAFWAHIADRTGGAALIESYSEGNTYSRAYDAPGFAPLAGASISLQAAAHLDTETGRWRLTLGTPAIMTEF